MDVVSRLDMSHKSTEYQPESRYTTNIYASCKAHRVDLFKFVRLTFSFFLIFCVCLCVWQQGLRFPSSSYRNPIASRRNQIDSLRLSDRYYIPKTTTHTQKKTDWLEQKTTQIGVALLFSRVSFRINGLDTVSIEFTFKIRAKHFFRSSLISFVSKFPVVEINESVSRIFFSHRKKKKRIKMNSVF